MTTDPKAGAEGENKVIRLASIVAIDVVGFSAMSEKDQRQAAASVEALRTRIEKVATRNGGRIFNTAGDGFMLEFSAAGAALEAINELLDKRPKKEPAIRVGAHVGDVIVTVNNDLLGHGVNVAARLQSLAAPNSALVSGEFRSMARNSPQAAFQPKGRQPLENIDQRVATFAILSQKQRFRRLMVRSVVGLSVVGVLAAATVFAGPYALKYVDSLDLFAKPGAGDAAAVAPATPETVAALPPVAPVAPAPTAPAAPAPALKPGQVFKDCDTCPEMIVLPAGAFLLGSPPRERNRAADEAQKPVALPSYAIAIHEVTFAEWDACLAGGGCAGFSPNDRGWGRGRRPVVGVSWDDAQAYVQWLNRQVGETTYRLPSEAEWEYAARGGVQTAYTVGASIGLGQARFGGPRSDPVGSYAANAFGLYDVHGNAAEWVQDCYAREASATPVEVSGCPRRVVRGGDFSDPPSRLRLAARDKGDPARRAPGRGFRIVKALESY